MKITNQFKSKLKTYFIKRLGAFEYRHGWMRIPTCPYCGREHKLGVNLSMYRTNCFRCNAHPSPAQLIMDIEGFTEYHELINFLNNGQFDELQFKDLWICTGRLTFFLIAFTSAEAATGERSPAMSLMQMESAPMSAMSRACFAKRSSVWTGDIV